MMKNRAFSKHPWLQSNVNRSVSRIRREFGEETWASVAKMLELARAANDAALWNSVIDPLIEAHVKAEATTKSAEKEAARVAEEEKAAEEVAARQITDRLIRVSPVTSKAKIVRRVRN